MSYSNDYIFKIIEILGSLTKVTPLTGNKGEMLYRSKNPFDDKLYSKEEIKEKETSYERAVTTEFDEILKALNDLKNSQVFYDLMYLTRGAQKFTGDGDPLLYMLILDIQTDHTQKALIQKTSMPMINHLYSYY